MKRLYAIYSKRGLWVARPGAVKVVNLMGKVRAEKIAASLSIEHKQAYWVREVKVTQIR